MTLTTIIICAIGYVLLIAGILRFFHVATRQEPFDDTPDGDATPWGDVVQLPRGIKVSSEHDRGNSE